MPTDYDLIRIILDRLAKEGLSLALPVVGDVIIGTLEDIDASKDKAAIQNALNEIRKQLREVTTAIEFLEHPRTREFFELLKNTDTTKVSGQSLELDETISNLIDCLKDPSHAHPVPRLKDAIERYALSKGTLVSVNRFSEQDSLVIDIGELETGKLFFPLHFIKQSFQTFQASSDILQTPSLKALFDPPHYHGYPKWICAVSEIERYTLTAYPKLIELDSTRIGNPKQLDEVAISSPNSSGKFEYWPNGNKKQKFIVEVHLDNPVQLIFQTKGNTNSTILHLKLLYTDGGR